jgi:hypothetical protein
VANASGASALVVRPRPAAAGRRRHIARVIGAWLFVAVAIAAGGGYLVGQAGAPDVSAARSAGAQAGRTEGSRSGDDRGFRSGYDRGRQATYGPAYRSAYSRAEGESGR